MRSRRIHAFSALALLAAAALLPGALQAGAKSIYGEDDRLDLYALSPELRDLADSVVSLWKTDNIAFSGESAKLMTLNLGKAIDLCPGERFSEQPTGAFCSGALVAPDLVLTAGHCVKTDADCGKTSFVFGYALRSAGGAPDTEMPAGEVYSCAKVLVRSPVAAPAGRDKEPDFALVKLDRPVFGHKPLELERAGAPKAGDNIFVIGHPLGLPVKAAGVAVIREASEKWRFLADLDTFGGNSGSPVFDAGTRLVKGILVSGPKDFKAGPGGCTSSVVYPQDGGEGESVAGISAVVSFVPFEEKLP